NNRELLVSSLKLVGLMVAELARPGAVEIATLERNVTDEAVRLREKIRLRRLLIAILDVEGVFAVGVYVASQTKLFLVKGQRNVPLNKCCRNQEGIRAGACESRIKRKANIARRRCNPYAWLQRSQTLVNKHADSRIAWERGGQCRQSGLGD